MPSFLKGKGENEGWEGRVLALLVPWDSFQGEEERLTTMYGGVTMMAGHLFFCASTIRSRNQPSDLRSLLFGGQDPFSYPGSSKSCSRNRVHSCLSAMWLEVGDG